MKINFTDRLKFAKENIKEKFSGRQFSWGTNFTGHFSLNIFTRIL